MITIRKARPDEVKQLQDLNDVAFEQNPQFDPDLILDWAQSEKGKAYFTTVLANPNDVLLVAEDGDKLVGYISASPKVVGHRKSTYIEIDNLGVHKDYRRKGVASLLMEECLKWAKEQGYQKAYLLCYWKNIDAIAFYKQKGFSEIDVALEKQL